MKRRSYSGFSLVELLAAVVVLSLLMTIVFGMTMATERIWRNASGKLNAFASARTSFDTLTRTLAQATLNTYWDYDDPNAPSRYLRQSELHFVCGPASTLLGGIVDDPVSDAVFFQAPTGYSNATEVEGLSDLLNNLGYFVSFGPPSSMPSFLQAFTPPSKLNRFCLIQFKQPAEDFDTYQVLSGGAASYRWFQTPINNSSATTFDLGKNVVALILEPRVPTAADGIPVTLDDIGKPKPEIYDSRDGNADNPQPVWVNQMPPVMGVTVVAIDEPSAMRLVSESGVNQLIVPNFDNPSTLDDDLAEFELLLREKNTNYRIFRKTVEIRSAKWSP